MPDLALPVLAAVMLVPATVAFARAVQGMFQRAYGQRPGRITDAPLGLAWLAGLALWIAIISPLGQALESVGGVAFVVVPGAAVGWAFWLWTPLVSPGGREWRPILQGALLSGALGASVAVVSVIYLPILMERSGELLGRIGVTLVLQSWLLVFATVIAVGAVFGWDRDRWRVAALHGARPAECRGRRGARRVARGRERGWSRARRGEGP